MDRRRRSAIAAASSGSNRRRHRMESSRRDSPDGDEELESKGSGRSRDKVKKDGDGERLRERERDSRERPHWSIKRRRAEKGLTGNGTSDESVEEEEDEENAVVRVAVPPLANHHHGGALTNHHHSHRSNSGQQVQNSNSGARKADIPGSSASKNFRSPPSWKTADEMIGVPVPRKARSASAKRSHDWISSSSNNNSSGVVSGCEQTPTHESSSPARQAFPPSSTPVSAAPVSPSSSNASGGKMLKTSVVSVERPKMKPPKASQKQSPSNSEELEIEIAEVLYGMMTQSQGRSSIKKEDSREAYGSNTKSRKSLPISNPSSFGPLSVSAPKRKRPRKVPDTSGRVAVSSELEGNQPLKAEGSSSLEKPPFQNGYESGATLVGAHEQLVETTAAAKPPGSKRLVPDLKEKRDFSANGEKESFTARQDENIFKDLPFTTAGSSVAAVAKPNVASESEAPKGPKLEINLMAPPPQPEGDGPDATFGRGFDLNATQQQIHPKASKEDPVVDKQSLPPSAAALSLAGWPPTGASSQGVESMEGNAPRHNVQPSSSLTRPKRCATHFHIAKNIHSLQQFMKMGPFWAGSSSSSGPKSSNPDAASTQWNPSLGAVHSSVDKERSAGGGTGKEKISQQTSCDSRKQPQVLIQQAMPPGNLLGPAFIFPLNQQQPHGAAVGDHPGAPKKSSTSASNGSSALSFSYSPNETQYLAILPNNGYTVRVPGAGAPPGYSGAPPPAMLPLFNGSFFSPQMIHPSQIPAAQVAQLLQTPPNASAPNSSNSSQKLLLQQSNSQYAQPAKTSRRHDGGSISHAESTSTKDGTGVPVAMNVYSQFYPQNFTLMASPASVVQASASNSQSEKVSQQQGVKPCSEPPTTMSFGSVNGMIPCQAIETVSAARNHAIFQSNGSLESARQNAMMAAVSGVAQAVHKNSFRVSEDARSTGVDSSTSGVVFPRSELPDTVQSKVPRAVSGFPNLIQSSDTSSSKSLQWKASRASSSQAPSSSLTASAAMTLQNLASQTPVYTQISFGGDQKKLSSSHGQAPPSSNGPSSSSMTVVSPVNPASKGATGSSRVGLSVPSSASGQASSLSGQPPQSDGAIPSQKSASVLGNTRMPSSGAQSQAQQQLLKAMHRGRLYFSNPCTQSQSPHSSSTSSSTSAPGGYFATRRPPEHQLMPPSSSGMLSTATPAVSVAGTTTSDPAAAANVKGGGTVKSSQFTPQSSGTVLPAGFTYLQQVPAAVQVKHSEQKLPAA